MAASEAAPPEGAEVTLKVTVHLCVHKLPENLNILQTSVYVCRSDKDKESKHFVHIICMRMLDRRRLMLRELVVVAVCFFLSSPEDVLLNAVAVCSEASSPDKDCIQTQKANFIQQ